MAVTPVRLREEATMRRNILRWLGSVACGALLAGFGSANISKAEIVTYATVSGWDAFGGTTDNGTKVCGVSTSGNGKSIAIKYFAGDNNVIIHLTSDRWQLKEGVHVRVQLRFDQGSSWAASAVGFHSGDAAVLEGTVPYGQIRSFFNEFRVANTLAVQFPNQNVEEWSVYLSGTDEIANKFIGCIGWMSKGQQYIY